MCPRGNGRTKKLIYWALTERRLEGIHKTTDENNLEEGQDSQIRNIETGEIQNKKEQEKTEHVFKDFREKENLQSKCGVNSAPTDLMMTRRNM
jgi:hypothetical protein